LGRIDGYGGGDGGLRRFAEHIAPRIPNAHLLLVGPAFEGIADDPESAEVFAGCVHRGRTGRRDKGRGLSISLPEGPAAHP
jgi:hypothetical protein